jgi:ABC-type transporter Mla maintaining outer membrane lipid asymmetry ATPase subunit MlaF
MEPPVIEVRDVTCLLGGRRVLDHVDLTVRKVTYMHSLDQMVGGKQHF